MKVHGFPLYPDPILKKARGVRYAVRDPDITFKFHIKFLSLSLVLNLFYNLKSLYYGKFSKTTCLATCQRNCC